MGNHKKYRIKSLYDNKMAVKTDSQAVRLRTLFRMKAMLLDSQTPITLVTSFRVRQAEHRLSLISSVSLSLTALKRRLRRKTTVLRSLPLSLIWQTLRRLRLHRMHSFLRALPMRWMHCTID